MICVGCGKNREGKELEGSMKHPYCRECFKKFFDSDYQKYKGWMERYHI